MKIRIEYESPFGDIVKMEKETIDSYDSCECCFVTKVFEDFLNNNIEPCNIDDDDEEGFDIEDLIDFINLETDIEPETIKKVLDSIYSYAELSE